MEMPSNSQLPTNASIDTDNHEQETVQPDTINHGGMEQKQEIAEEEVRGTLEAIASTGKFWHDWEKLKSMLSYQLKQVLSEYPEAKLASEQQIMSLGETFLDLVKRLDGALFNFIEGPPFTVQRICEIILDARGIYPNLSKLALALDKNLSVTSTLAVCTNPCLTSTAQKPVETENKEVEQPELQPNSVENGIEPRPVDKDGDKDEVMADVEETDANDEMTIDMEAFEEIVGPAETNATPTCNP